MKIHGYGDRDGEECGPEPPCKDDAQKEPGDQPNGVCAFVVRQKLVGSIESRGENKGEGNEPGGEPGGAVSQQCRSRWFRQDTEEREEHVRGPDDIEQHQGSGHGTQRDTHIPGAYRKLVPVELL